VHPCHLTSDNLVRVGWTCRLVRSILFHSKCQVQSIVVHFYIPFSSRSTQALSLAVAKWVGEFISGIDFDFEILLYVSPTCFLAQLNLTFSEVNCSLPNNGGSIEYFLQAFFPHVTKTSSCPGVILPNRKTRNTVGVMPSSTSPPALRPSFA